METGASVSCPSAVASRAGTGGRQEVRWTLRRSRQGVTPGCTFRC